MIVRDAVNAFRKTKELPVQEFSLLYTLKTINNDLDGIELEPKQDMKNSEDEILETKSAEQNKSQESLDIKECLAENNKKEAEPLVNMTSGSAFISFEEENYFDIK